MSFDHLIRPLQHINWNRQTNLFCCLEVNDEYDEFKLRRLLHREIGGLGAFQDLVYVTSRATVQVVEVRPVGHETASSLASLRPQ
jgi:hypothetical protein